LNKSQLAHIIRAAADITGERVFVVVGSQAILAQYPDAPEDLLGSNEADIYPMEHPELADEIDGAIGEYSQFHEQFGYYAEGVGPETAKLPPGWEERAFRMENIETKGAVGICPEIHDLAASKLVAGREKDVEWVQSAFNAGFLQRDLLETRIWQIDLDQEILVRADDRLNAMAPPPRLKR
jgi:uncharacterized nucleotidyltransferase DUF6036